MSSIGEELTMQFRNLFVQENPSTESFVVSRSAHRAPVQSRTFSDLFPFFSPMFEKFNFLRRGTKDTLVVVFFVLLSWENDDKSHSRLSSHSPQQTTILRFFLTSRVFLAFGRVPAAASRSVLKALHKTFIFSILSFPSRFLVWYIFRFFLFSFSLFISTHFLQFFFSVCLTHDSLSELCELLLSRYHRSTKHVRLYVALHFCIIRVSVWKDRGSSPINLSYRSFSRHFNGNEYRLSKKVSCEPRDLSRFNKFPSSYFFMTSEWEIILSSLFQFFSAAAVGSHTRQSRARLKLEAAGEREGKGQLNVIFSHFTIPAQRADESKMRHELWDPEKNT